MSSDLAFYLKRLRLSHMNEHLPPLLERAMAEEWSYQEFLTSLLEAEVFSREQQAIEQRMRTAHLPARKTLEQFDFSFQTSVKRQILLHLANLDFIQTRTNVLFVGPPGTGKTHLAIALSIKACQAGYKVLFLTAVELVTQLLEAEQTSTMQALFKRLAKPELLVIDEVGYIPFGREAANLFLQVVNLRYEHGSLIVTSNRAFSAWGEIFGGDTVVAAALIDRLVLHAEIISLPAGPFGKRFQLPAEGQRDPRPGLEARGSVTSKWCIFTLLFLVHFSHVDNNRIWCLNEMTSPGALFSMRIV